MAQGHRVPGMVNPDQGTSGRYRFYGFQDAYEAMNKPEQGGPPQELATMNSHSGTGRKKSLDHSRSMLIQNIQCKDLSNIRKTLKDRRGRKAYRLILDSDHFGVTALEYAVRASSQEMVDEMLAGCEPGRSKTEVLKHALLFAIKENNVDLVDHLLDYKAQMEKTSDVANGSDAVVTPGVTIRTHRPSDDASDVEMAEEPESPRRAYDRYTFHYEDAEYADDMTPLVLAAHLEHHDIIRLLLLKDKQDIHPLTVPCHHTSGGCLLCGDMEELVGSRSLEASRRFITLYRALSSPAYIFQSSCSDPILEAFLISHRLDDLMEDDLAFREEYDALSRECRSFATELLSLCRDSDEVETLFSHPAGVDCINPRGQTKEFPRLLVALHYNQKGFIAHPNCQQILQKRWYQDLPHWVRHTNYYCLRLATYTALMTVLLPVFALLFMFRVPWVSPYMKPPAAKFLNDTLCFILFLILLILDSVLEEPIVYGQNPTAVEVIVYVWILGLTLTSIKANIRQRGCSLTCNNLSNISWKIYDIFLLLCFWSAFILRMVGIGYAHQKGMVGLDRHQWCNMWDPHLLSEGCWAVGVILAVMKVNGLFKASSHLGPLQISLKRMIYDVIRFLFIFAIVLSAFAVGMTSLYRSYKDARRFDPSDPEEGAKRQPEAFINLHATTKTLFWNLFGYGEPVNADIVVGNVPEVYFEVNHTWHKVANSSTCGQPGTIMKHKVTEAFGYSLHALYHVVVIIVLLNMLIAMMAGSYNDIEKNADMEWKFARTRLRMSFFNEVGCLPSPFNVLPIRPIIRRLAKWKRHCCGEYTHEDHCLCRQCRKRKREYVTTLRQNKYKKLMENLAKRYWNRRKPAHHCPTEVREIPRDMTCNSMPNTPTLLLPGSTSSII